MRIKDYITNRSMISILSTAFLLAAALVGAYGLYLSYLSPNRNPALCSVAANKPLLLMALGFAMVSFLLSFLEKPKKRESSQNFSETQE